MNTRPPPCKNCEALKVEIYEALSHLGAAVSQSLPTDDQTIMQHVRDALTLLKAAHRRRV
jgi:hypothetical protein